MLPPASPDVTIERTVREEWGRILAALVRSLGDFQLAEDCLQDAIAAAIVKWGKDGLPRSPAAWLITTARRKAIDRLRRDKVGDQKLQEIAYLTDLENQFADEEDPMNIPDKRLEMIFTCCHPALEEKTRVALTLRTLGGMTTDEIARAFLDRPDAMAQRLVRAKKKIKLAAIPYEIPGPDDISARMSAVLCVIYLIFNEGYASAKGQDLVRSDLTQEAIRLARIVGALMPEETEVAGLLALMLLHDSRRFARTDDAGDMIALEDQNRARWDQSKIQEGVRILTKILPLGRIGPYQIQAAISAVHSQSRAWPETDWAQIVGLYGLLNQMNPSPVVQINQAVAVSFAQSIEAGLQILDGLKARVEIANYQPFFAAYADLLLRSGDLEQGKIALNRAIELSENTAEQTFLRKKAVRFGLGD